eukprot:5396362-Prymnesium_polylepis.1
MPPRSGRETSARTVARTVCMHQKVRTPYSALWFWPAGQATHTRIARPVRAHTYAMPSSSISARLHARARRTQAKPTTAQRAHIGLQGPALRNVT